MPLPKKRRSLPRLAQLASSRDRAPGRLEEDAAAAREATGFWQPPIRSKAGLPAARLRTDRAMLREAAEPADRSVFYRSSRRAMGLEPSSGEQERDAADVYGLPDGLLLDDLVVVGSRAAAASESDEADASAPSAAAAAGDDARGGPGLRVEIAGDVDASNRLQFTAETNTAVASAITFTNTGTTALRIGWARSRHASQLDTSSDTILRFLFDQVRHERRRRRRRRKKKKKKRKRNECS
jgi:hypothetical protein